jgi:hypothetical protein
MTPDINRALTFLPGVTTSNDLTAELNIRGGSPDQNLVLLDGVPVYYPFHIFGLTSAFNPDMLDHVTFSPGGFSAAYGGRLGAVLDIKSHVPQKDFELSADVSMVTANMTLGGRWKNRLNGILSVRKSFYDIVFKNTDSGIPYAFYDLFTRITVTPDPNNSLSLMVFSFRDRFRDQQRRQAWIPLDDSQQTRLRYTVNNNRDYSWGNRLFGFTWKRRLPFEIEGNLHIYTSQAKNRFKDTEKADFSDIPPSYESEMEEISSRLHQDNSEIINTLVDKSLRLQLKKSFSEVTLRTGVTTTRYEFDYGWINQNLPGTPVLDYDDYIKLYFDHAPIDLFEFTKSVPAFSGFIESEWSPFSTLACLLGTRISKWHNTTVPEPRISVRYKHSDFSFQLALSRHSQGIATALEEGVIGFLRLYFPLSDSLKPEIADHVVVGLEYEHPDDTFSIAVNGYLKSYEDWLKATGPDPTFIQTPARSYGGECLFNSSLWGGEQTLAFTLARSYRLVSGEKIDFNWDQRLGLDVHLSQSFGDAWTVNLMWALHSGNPFDPDTCYTVLKTTHFENNSKTNLSTGYRLIPTDVPQGRIRYPWYHRLDISVEREWYLSCGHLTGYVSMINVYNRKNPLYYKRSELAYETDNGKIFGHYVKHPFKWLPPIPTIGLRFVY